MSASRRSRTAVFLDRDGTLAPDVHYCRRVEDFCLFPDAGAALRVLNEAGLRVIVVTNQSGLARGYFDLPTLNSIHEHMLREVARQGARIDAVYYCPHHPDEGCLCRKPQPGMLVRASKELDLELARSFLIGDQPSDVGAAHAAGCAGVLVRRAGQGELQRGRPPAPQADCNADYTAGSLLEAARWIAEAHAHAVSC